MNGVHGNWSFPIRFIELVDRMRSSKGLSGSMKPGLGESFFPLEVLTAGEAVLVKIELSMAITSIFLVGLFLLGSIRRFVRFGWVLWCATKIIYMVTPLALIYIMTMMHTSSTIHVLYPVWACALIYAYGGVATTTAFSLADHTNILYYAWGTVPLLVWTLYLAYMVYAALPYPLVFLAVFAGFLFVAAHNTFQTLKTVFLASKSNGLPGLVKPLVQYMEHAREGPTEGSSFTSYRYVVWGNPVEGDDRTITTTMELWKSLEEFGDKKERLWFKCISYAYFRLLLRRFAGCPLFEISEPRTRKFVNDSLMLSNFWNEPERVSERVFTVIEEELSFLFDFFYTKSFVYSSYRFRDIWVPLCNAALLAIFSTGGISYLVSMTAINGLNNNRFHGHGLEVGVTRLVTLLFSALEVCKFAMVYFSNRKMVWLLCAPPAIRESWIAEKVNFWSFKEELCRRCGFLSRPWQRELGQYSFLDSYDQVPVLAWPIFTSLGILVKLPRVGQKGEYSIALSTQVKQAIVASLIPHVQDVRVPLRRGKATTERYMLPDIATFACTLKVNAQVILVWHIATHICESSSPPQDTENDHFLVATQLSKYCAYLVSSAPELLPGTGSSFTTETAFDMAVNQAHRELNGLDIFKQLPQLINKDDKIGNDCNIIVVGAKLASALVDPILNHPDRGWKVMAEFWAELLLSVAPSYSVAAHGDYLARGGEFITHVWALLTHAGIIER